MPLNRVVRDGFKTNLAPRSQRSQPVTDAILLCGLGALCASHPHSPND